MTSTPQGPTPGFWQEDSAQGCAGCSEFYVSVGVPYIDDFAIYVSVSGCEKMVIHENPEEPVVNNQFSFTGSFFANGTFDSPTSLSGTYGLSYHYIPGCGYISLTPRAYHTAWVNSSQTLPDYDEAVLVAPDTGIPLFVDPGIWVEFLRK